MADATHKTLSDEVERWKSINFYLSMVKYIICNVLRILLYIAAYMMRKCSSLFESLSDNLKTVEKAKDPPENRCDANSVSNHTNQNEKLKGEVEVINDTVNEIIEIECNSYSNHIDENEELNESNKVVGDIVNELIDSVTKECDDYYISNNINQNEKPEKINKVINDTVNELIDKITTECNVHSVFEHNIVSEQKLVNGVIADTVNSKLNKASDSQHYEIEQNSNSENSEEKVEEKIITCRNIGSTRVRKRHPIKNTAMLLITKTINENKLKDKIFKFETELNKNKMLNKETPNGNPYRDKEKFFTNKSDSFKKEGTFSLKNEPEKTDCFDLDVQKNIESIESKLKINGNEQLTMKNKIGLCENYDSYESNYPITKTTENMIQEMNAEYLKKYNGYENKKPITKIENMITTNNGERWDNYDGYENNKPISKTENIITTLNRDNDDNCENRKPITRTENMTSKVNSECWENNDSHEYKKPITKIEKMLNLFEVKDDIFDLPSTFSLAHCACEDFHNQMGMTADFKYKFGQFGELMDQHLHVSNVGHIIHDEQHIFYLIVKRKISHKPLLSTLEIALYNLRDKMKELRLTKLAIPKYGFDTFNMMDVKELISKIFTVSNIEVTICLTSSKLGIEHISPPKVNFTYKQLWEMEKQTDIIIFINVIAVYSENWNDKVVDHINAKYPFKERLLRDINIKPMLHGDLLVYKIDTEVLFCIFIKPFDQNPSCFRILEKTFQKMKSQLTGYRYFGIQQEPLSLKTNFFMQNLSILKSVFSNQNAEIWICGDTEQHKAYNYQQYRNIVHDAIEQNQKRISKTYAKSKSKLEKKKLSSNSNNSRYDSSEKRCSKNPSDINAVTYPDQEQISVDNYITENWDN